MPLKNWITGKHYGELINKIARAVQENIEFRKHDIWLQHAKIASAIEAGGHTQSGTIRTREISKFSEIQEFWQKCNKNWIGTKIL